MRCRSVTALPPATSPTREARSAPFADGDGSQQRRGSLRGRADWSRLASRVAHSRFSCIAWGTEVVLNFFGQPCLVRPREAPLDDETGGRHGLRHEVDVRVKDSLPGARAVVLEDVVLLQL